MPNAAKHPDRLPRAEQPRAATPQISAEPTYRLIKDGVERIVTASELRDPDDVGESNIQRLIRELRKLPAPSCIEERDVELIPEPKGLLG